MRDTLLTAWTCEIPAQLPVCYLDGVKHPHDHRSANQSKNDEHHEKIQQKIRAEAVQLGFHSLQYPFTGSVIR